MSDPIRNYSLIESNHVASIELRNFNGIEPHILWMVLDQSQGLGIEPL